MADFEYRGTWPCGHEWISEERPPEGVTHPPYECPGCVREAKDRKLLTEFLLARIVEDENTDPPLDKGWGDTRGWREHDAKRCIVQWAITGDAETLGIHRSVEVHDLVLKALACVYVHHPDFRSRWMGYTPCAPLDGEGNGGAAMAYWGSRADSAFEKLKTLVKGTPHAR